MQLTAAELACTSSLFCPLVVSCGLRDLSSRISVSLHIKDDVCLNLIPTFTHSSNHYWMKAEN